MEIQVPRGMRDFPPQEKLQRDILTNTLKKHFERFGFGPLETPIVERYDVLSAKYAGGAEILKETFRLTDQGGRELCLRYDLTVPLARFIAMNTDVKFPFKRYAIGTVYRDGPIKLGRYREFYQCDCDIVGSDGVLADVQCLQLAIAIFDDLGMEFRTYFNTIALLKAILREEGVPEGLLERAMLTLDKLKKIGADGVRKELGSEGIAADTVDGIIEVSSLGSNKDRADALAKRYGDLPGLSRIKEILDLVPDSRVEFDPSLARGLAYYTGVVFETFLEGSSVTGSVSSGGRYDRMIGAFAGKPDQYPAVGLSFGLEPIMDALKEKGTSHEKAIADVFVIPIKTLKESNALAQDLRAVGIRADVDLMDRGVSKNLDYASQLGIPHVVIVGKRELESGEYTLKNMRSGEEKAVARERLAEILSADGA